MFPEGHGRPRAVARDGAAAPLINELLVNTKVAIDELWRARGYDKLRPEQIEQRLGYKLDREEAAGYVLTGALNLQLLSPIEARTIGKRIISTLGSSGALGKKLAAFKKRGKSKEADALLQEKATLSLAPPPRKPAAPGPSPPPPSPPPPPPPPPPVLPSPLPSSPPPATSTAAATAAAIRLLHTLGPKPAKTMSDAMFSASEIEEAQGKIDRIDRGLEGWEPYDGYHAQDRGDRQHDLTWLVPDYRAALQLLKEHGLGMCCDGFETGECVHGTQCECGWQRAPWPWVVYQPRKRFCDCHRDVRAGCMTIHNPNAWVYRSASQLYPNDGPHRGNGS